MCAVDVEAAEAAEKRRWRRRSGAAFGLTVAGGRGTAEEFGGKGESE